MLSQAVKEARGGGSRSGCVGFPSQYIASRGGRVW